MHSNTCSDIELFLLFSSFDHTIERRYILNRKLLGIDYLRVSMKENIKNIECEVCSNQLTLHFSKKEETPNKGICNECGAMYRYKLNNNRNIESVELSINFKKESEIINEYYEETENKAFLITTKILNTDDFEYNEDSRKKFIEWLEQNYPYIRRL